MLNSNNKDSFRIIKTTLNTFVLVANTDTNDAMKNIVYSCLNNNLLKFHFSSMEQVRLLLIQLEDAQSGAEVTEIIESIDTKYNIFLNI